MIQGPKKRRGSLRRSVGYSFRCKPCENVCCGFSHERIWVLECADKRRQASARADGFGHERAYRENQSETTWPGLIGQRRGEKRESCWADTAEGKNGPGGSPRGISVVHHGGQLWN